MGNRSGPQCESVGVGVSVGAGKAGSKKASLPVLPVKGEIILKPQASNLLSLEFLSATPPPLFQKDENARATKGNT